MENESNGVKLEATLDKVHIPEFKPGLWIKAMRIGAWVLAIVMILCGIGIGASNGGGPNGGGVPAALGAILGMIIGAVAAFFFVTFIMVFTNLVCDASEIKELLKKSNIQQ